MADRRRATPRHARAAASDADAAVRLAAIDIGSNSIRQLVADVAPTGQIRVVDEMKAAPRLAAGLAETGALREDAMAAAVEVLGHMATVARRAGAARVEAVATSAVREASNGDAFRARVREATGLDVRVLSGEDEARLSFRSALAHFDLVGGRTAVVDIGGGSLELALSAGGLLEHLVSLPLGAVRLTEEHRRDAGPDGELRHADVRQLRRTVRAALRRALARRDWLGAQLIGSGGTFTNLAQIHLARQGMETVQTVQGTRVPLQELEHILDVLVSLPLEERRRVPGLNPARADIIVAGLAVAAETARFVDAPAVVVSSFGIREGLLLETAQVRPTPAEPGAARARSVKELGERTGYDARHAAQVRRLALQLFAALAGPLGLEEADRETLADAALLHDIGYHISHAKHHKHSYHLIVHAELLGMSPQEQVAIANVARYHSGAGPKKRHANFGVLDRPTRRRIRRLAAILRVADALDRGHVGAVERVRARWTDDVLRLTVTPRAGLSVRLERWGAERKCDLLARVAGRRVEIVERMPARPRAPSPAPAPAPVPALPPALPPP